jgi:hypothetical protein
LLLRQIQKDADPTNMFRFLREIVRSRYVGLLEADVARLRAENRALMNSLLGTAGFPPVEFPEVPQAQSLPRLRKRSWHQIQAWRENGAAREPDLPRGVSAAENCALK